jgi:xanthine dehydrogenase YagS FAD-binding subunit
MEAFEYASPTTKQEAVGLLAERWGETEILAGGSDLLSLMKNYVVTPKRVVSLKGITELSGIRETAEGVVIGALTTMQELHDKKTIHDQFHSLAHAAGSITSAQIRNMGTVGGDLCQRPRCWYFRNGFGLLAKDAKGQPLVPGGDNRYHAIFGHEGGAYFVNPSSLAPALVALGAKVRIFGPKGQREVSVAEFLVAPKSDTERENMLKPNEILTEIVIPASAKGWRNETYEVRQKESLDWPLATASVALRMEGTKVALARIVMGHVAPVPWPAKQAAQSLVGKTLNEDTAKQAAEAAIQGAKPLSMNKYKVQLARVAVKRALMAVAASGQPAGSLAGEMKGGA